MYAGISRFLSRLKTKVADFSSFVGAVHSSPSGRNQTLETRPPPGIQGVSKEPEGSKPRILSTGSLPQKAREPTQSSTGVSPQLRRSTAGSQEGKWTESAQQKTKACASLGYLAADDVAYMPFYQEDRLALRIGESSHKGHEFVRETANAIKGIPDLYKITCDEIAWKLNKLGTPIPRGGRWNGRLVFHFTRHYMQIRPAFFEEDVARKAPF